MRGRARSVAYPPGVIEILQPLRDLPGPELRRRLDRFAADERLLVVGGAIRDLTLGRPTRDLDLAGSADPARVAQALAGSDEAGHIDPSLGTWNWVFARDDGVEIDVAYARFRRESDYGPDRRPRSLRFLDDPVEDSARRDFTTNAIYLDWRDGRIVDPWQGLADLAERTLRMVGDPAVRLDEDPLRILRAVRFAGRLSLTIEPSLETALRALAPRTASLSGGRLFDEWTGALVGVGAPASFDRLLDWELFSAFDAVWTCDLLGARERIRDALGRLAESSLAAESRVVGVWTILLAGSTPEVREEFWRRVAAPRSVRVRVEALGALSGPEANIGFVQDLEHRCGGRVGLDRTLGALDRAEDPCLARVVRGVEELPSGLAARWAKLRSGQVEILDGKDLIAQGARPGPGFGELLERIRTEARGAGLRTREEALAWLAREAGKGRLTQ